MNVAGPADGAVSGLARGIDAAAHRASLSSGTIGILAGGPDHIYDLIYPAEHGPLADSIREHGVLLSEMPLSWEPRPRQAAPLKSKAVFGKNYPH